MVLETPRFWALELDEDVLILVWVEYGLGDNQKQGVSYLYNTVLILVWVEYGLGVY